MAAGTSVHGKMRTFDPLPLTPSRGGEGKSMRDLDETTILLEGEGEGGGDLQIHETTRQES